MRVLGSVPGVHCSERARERSSVVRRRRGRVEFARRKISAADLLQKHLSSGATDDFVKNKMTA